MTRGRSVIEQKALGLLLRMCIETLVIRFAVLDRHQSNLVAISKTMQEKKWLLE